MNLAIVGKAVQAFGGCSKDLIVLMLQEWGSYVNPTYLIGPELILKIKFQSKSYRKYLLWLLLSKSLKTRSLYEDTIIT